MIGTDIIEIGRIKDAAQNPRFLERIFTPAEIEYITKKGQAAETIAGLFAAKEAVVKAIGTGFSRGISHKDIEITHDGHGAPQVILYGAAKIEGSIYVSISHCKTFATATAIVK